MGWFTSTITMEHSQTPVEDDIIYQLYGVDILYMSDCSMPPVYVAYCENREVRGLVVWSFAKKIANMDLIEVTTKMISLEEGPVECPRAFFDMLTPPTSKEKDFLIWYLKAGKFHGI